MPRLNWKTPIYGGDTLNFLFCRYKMEGKTLDEIMEQFVSLTGMHYETLAGPLRLVNMRHEWLVNGWRENVNHNIYSIAKKAYIDEYLNQGGEVHDTIKSAIRNFYGGEYFPE